MFTLLPLTLEKTFEFLMVSLFFTNDRQWKGKLKSRYKLFETQAQVVRLYSFVPTQLKTSYIVILWSGPECQLSLA